MGIDYSDVYLQDVLQLMGLSVTVNFIFCLVGLPGAVQRGQAVLPWLLVVLITGVEPYLMALLIVRRIIFITRLRQQHIFVSDSSRMTKAAMLDMVMLDKTGTLTVDQVSCAALVPSVAVCPVLAVRCFSLANPSST